MKAVVCTTLGEPNLLEIKDNPIPEPQKNEVLIMWSCGLLYYQNRTLFILKVIIKLNIICFTSTYL